MICEPRRIPEKGGETYGKRSLSGYASEHRDKEDFVVF